MLNRVSSYVRFKAPGYSYAMIEQDEDDLLPADYDLDDFQYKSTLFLDFNEQLYNPDIDIAAIGYFKNIWGFRKALFGDKYDNGTLSFTLGLRHIARFGSLFKPQNMEKAAIEDIDLAYGPKSYLAGEGSGGRRYQAPLDWSIHSFNNLEWIHFKSHHKKIY